VSDGVTSAVGSCDTSETPHGIVGVAGSQEIRVLRGGKMAGGEIVGVVVRWPKAFEIAVGNAPQ